MAAKLQQGRLFDGRSRHDGADQCGSAHFCRISGLKPTPGRIPGTGHFPRGLGRLSLGVVGPMARTVAMRVI